MAKILLIDDEVNIRMMIRLTLERNQKYHVETAADGPEGLDKFGEGSQWDLVLLDHRMPGMDGLEVLHAIRLRAPRARVIMITAFGTIDLLTAAMEAGASEFLRKPFTADTLRGAVEAALATNSSGRRTETNRVEPDAEIYSPITFSSLTLNGFRIEFVPSSGEAIGADTLYTFHLIGADRNCHPCTVLLPNYMKELVRAHTNREQFPGKDRFWQAICEETLTNYILQHAGPPAQGVLRVEELTPGLRGWIDAVLAGSIRNASR